MKKDIQYITQLSSADLADIAAVANMSPGIGIKITRNGDSVCIELDRQAIACMMQSFCNQKRIGNDTSIDPRSMDLDLS